MASVQVAQASSCTTMKSLPLLLDRLPTPIGVMLLVTDDRDRLRALDWEDHEPRMLRLMRLQYGSSTRPSARSSTRSSARPADGRPAWSLHAGSSRAVRAALEAYFAGDVGAIDRVAVETGGTPFQRDVWAALRRIPAGETLSYGALAARIERRSAVRAVGRANGANPVGIVVPCHRVIGADASLTGYGGGLDRKRWLLRHEGATHADGAAS
jgi:methylated-DNA-[protein]-cysteine S-methyltransferase